MFPFLSFLNSITSTLAIFPPSFVLTKLDKFYKKGQGAEISDLANQTIANLGKINNFSGHCFGFTTYNKEYIDDLQKEIFEICKSAFIR